MPSIVSNRVPANLVNVADGLSGLPNEPLLALQSVCLMGNRGQGIGDQNRGPERVEKCRFAISTESALKNSSFRALINDDCNVWIHFRSPDKSPRLIFSRVPDGTFPLPYRLTPTLHIQ